MARYTFMDNRDREELENSLQEKTNTNSNIVSYFNLQRTGKVYTVRFPLWETSNTSSGEKLDDNSGLVCLPSTATEHRTNDYESIPLFRTYDCNAHVTDDGIRIVDAINGNTNFKDTGKVDVFVLGMSYYEKYWIEDGYWYYSRTDLPKEGYTLALECQNKDGSDQGFALYGKYVCGRVDGMIYSSKGLAPARNSLSYNSNITEFHKKGKKYCGGMLCDYKYIMTTFYLMNATLNTQSVMAGCTSYNFQYCTTVAETSANRIVVTNSQAANIIVGGYVSIGDNGDSTKASDRSSNLVHNLADTAKVLSKSVYDEEHTSIVIDATFTTTETTWISSMHWKSGFSDNVMGRFGSPCPDVQSLTNGKYPIVINGIELMVGGYEIGSNAIVDIVDENGTRDIYVMNNAEQLSSNITTIKNTYVKLDNSIHVTNLNAWNYITGMHIDVENGTMTITNAGETGSGSSTGFADGIYADTGTTGQREFLLLGAFWNGSSAGLSCLYAGDGLGAAGWNVLSRLSINGVGVNCVA